MILSDQQSREFWPIMNYQLSRRPFKAENRGQHSDGLPFQLGVVKQISRLSPKEESRVQIPARRPFMPNDNETEEKALARIHIGELQYEKIDNILSPYYDCFVITTAGQIWDIKYVLAFNCTKDRIQEVWNTERERFTKRQFQ